jgi:hypothetical protein
MMSIDSFSAAVDAFVESGGIAIASTSERYYCGPSVGAVVDLLLAWEKGEDFRGYRQSRTELATRLEEILAEHAARLSKQSAAPPFVLVWATLGGGKVYAAWSRHFTQGTARRELLTIVEMKLLVLR